MIIGIFEKDLHTSTLVAVPELYRTMGQNNSGFNIWIYFGWTAMAVAESMIVYFCMLTLFANAAITKDNTLFSMGDLSFVAVVIVISVKLQIIEMHNKSIVAELSVFLSTGAAFLWNLVLAAVYPPTSMYKARGGFFTGLGQNPTWWMTLVIIIFCVGRVDAQRLGPRVRHLVQPYLREVYHYIHDSLSIWRSISGDHDITKPRRSGRVTKPTLLETMSGRAESSKKRNTQGAEFLERLSDTNSSNEQAKAIIEASITTVVNYMKPLVEGLLS